MLERTLLPALALILTGQIGQSAVGILTAEDRRAPTAGDVAVIRAGLRRGDPEVRRIAVRALGRLERPSLIRDILPALSNNLPEIRAEAADAIGQAAQGWRFQADPSVSLNSVMGALVERLKVEAEPTVRAAITQTLGRLPYTTTDQVRDADVALVETASSETVTDRLGIAQGAEALIRLSRARATPSSDLVTKLRAFAISDPSRDARVRRLAMEALIASAAVDDTVLGRTAADPDVQVRRLAMRAVAGLEALGDRPVALGVLAKGRSDESAMVRIEALQSLHVHGGERACSASVAASTDRDRRVVLQALDQLEQCARWPEAIAVLEDALKQRLDPISPRGWHEAAHALVALAAAVPERATTVVPLYAKSTIWQLRMYAARASAILKDRQALEALAVDANDNVREAAIEGLVKVAGHAGDQLYLAALERPGYQAVRAGALALENTPAADEAVPSLKAAGARLANEGFDSSLDARKAIAGALASLGVKSDPPTVRRVPADGSEFDNEGGRRGASLSARVTVRDVGTFDMALIASEAPASVVRFIRLVDSGYYNGLTFHRVVPNFVVQGGSPGASEYVGADTFMRDEVGLWPHVRGAVGISRRGRDTGDGQFFIDLVDNPRLDHEYTVFAQLLSGFEVVDAILEGDVIERIEIVGR
jgi:cyclophilin family peptidyl-prolyl cis-trans isomerase/HEAT repeat protein